MESSMSEIQIPPYLHRFERLGYGLFLHWGLYSLLQRGEWVRFYEEIGTASYARLVNDFTADKFDATELVSFAKAAGFKYICLVTRHHDGFSLYDTRGLNTYDSLHSPAGRDFVREFSDACEAAGMAKFFYHTTIDWHAPSFHGDWNAYPKYLNDSVEILATHYGKVDGFWFDGNWEYPDRDWREEGLYEVVKKHQPEAVLVNNSSTMGRGKVGHPALDVVTFEQGVPADFDPFGSGRYLVPEMCETINSHWGTAEGDFSHKSPSQIIERLSASRGMGANFLVNIGPHPDGSLPAYERATLEVVGEWVKRAAPCIYEARPDGLVAKGRDFVLRDGSDYFYFLHDLPIAGNMHLAGERGDGLKTVEGSLPPINSVKWLDNDEPLDFWQDSKAELFGFRATANPYGQQLCVRVAKLSC